MASTRSSAIIAGPAAWAACPCSHTPAQAASNESSPRARIAAITPASTSPVPALASHAGAGGAKPSRPAGDARTGEQRREQLRRHFGEVEHHGRPELDVGRQHAVGLARLQLGQRGLLERLGDLEPRRADLARGAAQHAGARILGAVDAVAEAHQPVAAVEQAALAELKARKPDRVLATNVEFWSAVVLDFAEVPPELFTPLFSCARVAGRAAHILEQKREGRLIRPTAIYTGPGPRPVSAV